MDTIYTTLEDAVFGLTSGRPTTLPDFEGKLSGRLRKVFVPAEAGMPSGDGEAATDGAVPMGLEEPELQMPGEPGRRE